MTDSNFWLYDLENRNPTAILTFTLEGSIYIASSLDSSVVTNSGKHTSLFEAYKDLSERLLNEDFSHTALLTTTQRDALDEAEIPTTTVIDNITVGRLEKWNGTKWINVSRRSSVTGITASILQTQGEMELTADFNVIATVGTNDDSVTLPTAEAVLAVIVVNAGSKKLQIWPNTDDDLGQGVNSSTTIASGSAIIFYCYDDTTWVMK